MPEIKRGRPRVGSSGEQSPTRPVFRDLGPHDRLDANGHTVITTIPAREETVEEWAFRARNAATERRLADEAWTELDRKNLETMTAAEYRAWSGANPSPADIRRDQDDDEKYGRGYSI